MAYPRKRMRKGVAVLSRWLPSLAPVSMVTGLRTPSDSSSVSRTFTSGSQPGWHGPSVGVTRSPRERKTEKSIEFLNYRKNVLRPSFTVYFSDFLQLIEYFSTFLFIFIIIILLTCRFKLSIYIQLYDSNTMQVNY